MEKLIYASASELARLISAREVSSQEVVDAHLERIAAVNPKLNAVVQLRADAAREEARRADAALARGETKGPLHGVPITIKDGWEVTGVISTGGTKGLASYLPERDATVVARMRAAGAIILGKTNVPDLSLAYESDNLIYGRTNNPYDLSRTPGGSGGGEAAIIAAGGSPLDIGADSGGSIRLPCHYCGIAGLRPTTGRVPLTGYIPPLFGIMGQYTAAGPMARFAEDLMLALPMISGIDWRDPATVPMPLGDPRRVELKQLRAALYTDNGILTPTRETVEVVKRAAKSLVDAGVTVEEVRPPGIEQTLELFVGLASADGGAGIQMALQMLGTTQPHPLMRRLLDVMRASAISTAGFSGLLARWDMFRSAMLSFMERYDLIICPVNAYPALPHGTTFNDENIPAFTYTMTYNLTGWPGAVVRAGTSPEELPIGVQIVARPWREETALAAAHYLEAVLGGWQPPPI